MKLKKGLSWKSSNYLLGIIDIKVLWCATKSTTFSIFIALTVSLLHLFHAFLYKQRWQSYYGVLAYDYNSSKIRTNIPDLFPKQETLGKGCNIPSWALRCFKKSFLSLKKRTFQVKNSISSEVRRSEHSIPKKPWKESFLALFYEKFPAKLSISRAFLEP